MNSPVHVLAQAAGSDLTGVAGWITDIIERFGAVEAFWLKGRFFRMRIAA